MFIRLGELIGILLFFYFIYLLPMVCKTRRCYAALLCPTNFHRDFKLSRRLTGKFDVILQERVSLQSLT
jgi:hypothetical protein